MAVSEERITPDADIYTTVLSFLQATIEAGSSTPKAALVQAAG